MATIRKLNKTAKKAGYKVHTVYKDVWGYFSTRKKDLDKVVNETLVLAKTPSEACRMRAESLGHQDSNGIIIHRNILDISKKCTQEQLARYLGLPKKVTE